MVDKAVILDTPFGKDPAESFIQDASDRTFDIDEINRSIDEGMPDKLSGFLITILNQLLQKRLQVDQCNRQLIHKETEAQPAKILQMNFKTGLAPTLRNLIHFVS